MGVNTIRSAAEPYKDPKVVVDTVKALRKIGEKATALAGHFTKAVELEEASASLAAMGSVFTAWEGVESIFTFVENVQKKGLKGPDKAINILETISSVIGVASGVMSGMKVLNVLKAIDLSVIAKSMGSLQVVGPAFETVLTFSNVSMGLGIIRLTISIGISAIKLHILEKKIKKVKSKINLWGGQIDSDFIANRIIHVQTKQTHIAQEVNTIELKLQQKIAKAELSQQKFDAKKTTYKNKKSFKKASAWVLMKKAKFSLGKKVAMQGEIQAQTDQLNARKERMERKIENWTHIKEKLDDNTFTADETLALDKFTRDKHRKWRTKKENLHFSRRTLRIDTALKTAVLIIMIATFVLTLTGAAVAPPLAPLMITLCAISLALAVSNIGMDLLKRHKRPKIYSAVDVPSLA